ncbi:tripartite tricarboxylate transporter permease [Larsenimonas suaedae]|uniref:Tripartite tricarboxylate transporter permease n=1 Tax=Larsenimonas suaedae TaxID=1851019 RepID=A0ABU1GSI8_9GAMM|nr:tripartite tricarboxylate transporter permease [Larsenimonas suaedae]MCM2972207.1 tripartite tricarboxylate transporter permease [Larsenimonas suaedae]MDR5894997.1 tripartite tricarboxylate transporter permease [Larsenimonas suaedae]
MQTLVETFNLFSPVALLAILAGTFLGILLGALPGLSAAMAVALLLPITYGLDPISGIGLLLGAFCGAVAGGSVPAILLNMPGTPGSIATTFDAYPMATNGRAGKALGLSVASSFVGGMISAAILILVSPLIAAIALKFGAAEYFSLSILGLMIIVSLAGASLIKGLIAGLVGMLLSTVGADQVTGALRLTFDQMSLLMGVSLLAVIVGLFAVSQLLTDLEKLHEPRTSMKVDNALDGAFPRLREVLRNWKLTLMTSLVGTGVGAVPGAGGSIASIMAYDQAKRVSRTPEAFGKGAPEGVIASESSNNAMVGGALIPMLTLGIPGEGATAVLIGGLMIQGIQPGPTLFDTQSGLVYGIFVAFLLANIMMLFVQWWGIRLFVRLLRVPQHFLLPLIFIFCAVGVFSINSDFFDVYLMIALGVLGFLLARFGFGVAPVVIGLILGGVAETNLRRGLQTFDGSWMPFLTRPISLAFLVLALVFLLMSLRRNYQTAKA